nr:hypothetical protein Iba_chr12cCG5020 [Ipomoea batatas]
MSASVPQLFKSSSALEDFSKNTKYGVEASDESSISSKGWSLLLFSSSNSIFNLDSSAAGSPVFVLRILWDVKLSSRVKLTESFAERMAIDRLFLRFLTDLCVSVLGADPWLMASALCFKDWLVVSAATFDDLSAALLFEVSTSRDGLCMDSSSSLILERLSNNSLTFSSSFLDNNTHLSCQLSNYQKKYSSSSRRLASTALFFSPFGTAAEISDLIRHESPNPENSLRISPIPHLNNIQRYG